MVEKDLKWSKKMTLCLETGRKWPGPKFYFTVGIRTVNDVSDNDNNNNNDNDNDNDNDGMIMIGFKQ